MELTTAIALIHDGISLKDAAGQTWADLGAGSGLFSRALASLVPSGSKVYAVDKDAGALKAIRWDTKDTTLIPVASDITDELKLPALDGVLMANVLHFLTDHRQFLHRVSQMITKNGSIIIIEYDTLTGNRWVPYPISWDNMKGLAASGQLELTLLGREKSKFNAGSIYSALLRPQ